MAIKWKAVRYMVVGMLAFACLNFIVKYLEHISAFQLVFFRAVGTLFITLPIIYTKKLNPLGNRKFLLLARGLVGFTSLLLYFLALKMMPLGTCVTLRYLAPIFAAIFALWLLDEMVKLPQWLFFIISFSGVFLIKGFDPDLSILGTVLVIISGALSGLVMVIIRKIGYDDHPIVIVNYFMVVGVVLGIIGSLKYWTTPTLWDWPLLLLLGFFGFIGQYYMTKAVQLETTDVVAPIKYIEVPFTILIGISFFGESYGWLSLVGFVLIVAGLVANILYKERLKTKLRISE
ncbi:MAG: DMT family transporter [Saprospiraceae bacterium]|nr:DMT family transporter [Saprospiraceae bacterium]